MSSEAAVALSTAAAPTVALPMAEVPHSADVKLPLRLSAYGTGTATSRRRPCAVAICRLAAIQVLAGGNVPVVERILMVIAARACSPIGSRPGMVFGHVALAGNGGAGPLRHGLRDEAE